MNSPLYSPLYLNHIVLCVYTCSESAYMLQGLVVFVVFDVDQCSGRGRAIARYSKTSVLRHLCDPTFSLI